MFKTQQNSYVLGIESSCDETAAAVIRGNRILSNVIANQDVHRDYGGVVPELASRAHQQNIIPVVHAALLKAKVEKKDLEAIAFTRGPGLLGSLLVGISFAKSLSLALGIPLIDVDHLQAHILAHFIQDDDTQAVPKFPFLCLTVSGGHTQIVKVKSPLEMEIIGQTIDDAAGEAFDKAAKIMGLPYPGGPIIDKLAREGNAHAFSFSEPKIGGLDYSFSGLKTGFLYFLRDELKKDKEFIKKNEADLAASLQRTIIEILLKKLDLAATQSGIKEVAIAGGVSANSGLRDALVDHAAKNNWNLFLPKFSYSTDNAAMIAMAGMFKHQQKAYAPLEITPYARAGEGR